MAKYHTKRKAGKVTSSCAMCKPHKHGWAPKRTDREISRERADRREIQEHQ